MSSRYSIFHYSSTLEIFNFSQVFFFIVPFPTSRLFQWGETFIFFSIIIESKEIPFSSITRLNTFNCFFFFTFQSSHISISISIFLSTSQKKKGKKRKKDRFDCNHLQGTENRWIFHRLNEFSFFLCSAKQLQLDLSINRGKTSLPNGWP